MDTTEGSNSIRGAGADSSVGLRYVGATLTAIVAGIHLLHPGHGLIELFATLNTNPAVLFFDPRPVAFVASGTALLVGLSLSRNALNRRPYYLAGILLTLTYVVGFFAWHFIGHGGFLPGREPLLHGLSPVDNVVVHITEDVWAALAKLTEVALIIVLGVLYYRD